MIKYLTVNAYTIIYEFIFNFLLRFKLGSDFYVGSDGVGSGYTFLFRAESRHLLGLDEVNLPLFEKDHVW